MSTIRVHGYPGSTYTRAALLTLAEKGVAYELVPADLRGEAYRALHPWRKMPVLDHGDFRVYEALAVMRYVDEAFEGPALQPADAQGRARMMQWASAFNDYIGPKAVRGVLIPRFVLAPRGIPVDDASVARASASAHESFATFDAALARSPYLAGSAPSLADLLLLPVVAADAALAPEERFTTGYEHLADWARRMKARPSWAATKQG